MALISARRVEMGQVGDLLGELKIVTTDSLATVTAAGWLNRQGNVAQQLALKPMDLCRIVYSYNEVTRTGSYVEAFPSISSGVITLSTAAADDVPLASARIWVGNASGIQAPVAMSGDATISNTGVVTLAADSVSAAQIEDANVTLAKLAAGITPSHVIRFAGQHTTVGGGAAEAITVTGAAATDLAFVQMVDDGTSNVTIIDAVVTTNTLTVTFSADPGNDTIVNYQLINAAS